MLHLDPRVHLDEVELVVLVEKLQRAGVAVADVPACVRAALAHGLALLRGQARRRRLFDDLLMAALHGAVAFAQVHHIAVIVGQHLKLDVPRLLEKLLHVDLIIAERRQRLGLRHANGVEQRRVGMHHPHAAAAAAARSLDDHRVADVLGDAEILVRVLAQRPVRSRHAGNAGRLHQLDGGNLVAHEADRFRPRAHENEAALLDPLGEIGVFRQKAVTRMNRHRIGHFRRADDGGHIQVGQGRIAAARCRRSHRPAAHAWC